MKIARRLAILAGLVMCGLALECPPDSSFRRQACCGDRNATPPVAVSFSQQIATNAGDVPVELQQQRCGTNLEEITAITISGTLVGCAGSNSEVSFPTLIVDFTMDGARCGVGGVRHPRVTITNLVYTNRIDFTTLACVRTSAVNVGYTFFTADPGFATLFASGGPQTLLPILDRYVLGWGASIPAIPSSPPAPATCPPRPTLGGTTSRCPN
jgi:hypothetical protein